MRRVHREGLDGTGDGNEAWHTAERRKQPCVRPAMFETGSCSSGGVWCTTKWRKRTSYVRNGVLLIERGLAYRKTVEMDLLRSKRGSCSSGGVWRTAKRDSTGYCSSPPSTPLASTCDCSSIGSCSSSLHRALLHRLLFNHPSTGTPPLYTVHPALHTTGSCSTTPPRPPLHRQLFIQPSTPRGPVHPEATPPLTVHPIDRLQLAAVAKESLHRVQLTAIDRSLGFSNA